MQISCKIFFFQVPIWIYSFFFFLSLNISVVVVLSIGGQRIVFPPLWSLRLSCQQKDSWENWIKRMVFIHVLQLRLIF